MRFEVKQNEFVLMALLLIFTIALRLPLSNHAYGSTDSFFIMGLANSIIELGEAKWIISLYSFAGLYPLSYPSMAPYFFSGIAIISSISIENSVFLSNILLAILGTFSVYLLTKQISDNNFVAFFSAVAFSVSPVFIFYTNWAATARGTYIAILPFILYLIVKCYRQHRYIFLLIPAMILIMTSHRSFYFLGISLVAFVISLFVNKYIKVEEYSRTLRYSYIISFILLFLLQYSSITSEYSDGFLDINHQSTLYAFIISLANLIISFVGEMGILLVFAALGWIFLIKKQISFETAFILLTLSLSIPVITERQYIPLFLAPFISITIGYGVYGSYQMLVGTLWDEKKYNVLNYYYGAYFFVPIYGKIVELFKNQRNKLLFTCIFISVVLISSIIFSTNINSDQYQIGTNMPMSEDTYQTSLFISNNINSTLVSNNGLISSQVQAISGKPVLPSNLQLWYSPDQLIFDFEKAEEIEADLLPFRQLIPPPDVWFKFSGVSNLKDDYQEVMYFKLNSESSQKIIKRYDIEYLLADKRMPDSFISYGRRPSEFVPSVVENQNKIYDSRYISLYQLNE